MAPKIPRNDDAAPAVAQLRRAGDVRADEVALHYIRRHHRRIISSGNDEAAIAVTGNDVACTGCGAANRVVLTFGNAYAATVGHSRRARRVRADEIALNQIVCSHVVGVAANSNAGGVAGNDVARSATRAADREVRTVGENNARTVEVDSRRARRVDADVVALNHIARRIAPEKVYVPGGVAGDDVARTSGCAADSGVGRTVTGDVGIYVYADDALAYAATAQGGCARRVRADVVALNRGPGRGVSVNQNLRVVASDDVARGGRRAADGVVRRAFNAHAVIAVSGCRSAGRIEAEETTLNRVAAVGLQQDGRIAAITIEAIDDQSAHRAVARGDDESAADRAVAVQLDEMHGIVAHCQRVRARARLGKTVDHHRVADDGKRRQRYDRLQTRAGDGEADRVWCVRIDVRMRVRVENRLAERAGPAVARVNDVVVVSHGKSNADGEE